MNCMNCDGSLVYRQTFEHPLDENGVYHLGDEYTIEDYGVFCSSCGAKHDYETILSNDDGSTATIALLMNRDPHPVATLAISHTGGFIEQIDSKQAVGVIVIDEDMREVGLFMVRPTTDSPFLDRAAELKTRVKKGEWKAKY